MRLFRRIDDVLHHTTRALAERHDSQWGPSALIAAERGGRLPTPAARADALVRLAAQYLCHSTQVPAFTPLLGADTQHAMRRVLKRRAEAATLLTAHGLQSYTVALVGDARAGAQRALLPTSRPNFRCPPATAASSRRHIASSAWKMTRSSRHHPPW